MVDHDVRNDPTPKMTFKKPTGPTVAALKAAISGSGVAASYPAAQLTAATYNDLVYICKLHSIAVTGL